MRAAQTNNAKNLFIKYGFMPSNNFTFQGIHKGYRVFDEVNNKFVNYKYRNFLNDIKTGKVVEVDPFLHTLTVANRQRTQPRQVHTDRLTRYTEYFPIEQFKQEPRAIRAETMRKATELKKQASVRNHPDHIHIRRRNDEFEDKSSLYAIIDALYVISSYDWGNTKITLNVNFRMDNPIHDYHFPDIYYINKETVEMLENLIKNLYYGEEIIIQDKSDSYKFQSMREWESIDIVFDEDAKESMVNRLTNPNVERRRRAGAKWAWINTTPIDLSRYGIFNTYDKNNYRFPCFVYALEQSGVLTLSEIEFVKSVINTRSFPIDNIKLICEKLNISIQIYYYSSKQSRVYNSNLFGTNPDRMIKLLLRQKHYMLYEDVNICAYYIKNYQTIDKNIQEKYFDKRYMTRKLNNYGIPTYASKPLNINQIIDLFFECKYFKPLSPFQLSQTLFQKRDVDFVDLSYPDCCARIKEYIQPENTNKKTIFTSDIEDIVNSNRNIKINKYKGTIRSAETNDTIYKNTNIWFSFEEPTDEEIDRFKQVMQDKFDVNIDNFDSAASVGQELMHKYHCFDNVFELSGKPAIFLTNCAPKIALQPAFHEKQDISGDLVSIDKNGSYTSIYTQFSGIPCGKPKILTSFNPNNEFDDYYIYIDIKSIKCKHNEERFPTIQSLGANFLHKTIFENLLKHYDIEYEFISGYYFDEGFNDNIKRLALDLYRIRDEYKAKNDRINEVFKGILNTLWGKCTYKQKKLRNITKSIDEVHNFVNMNFDFIFQARQLNENSVSFSITKPLSLEYGIPQFSTNILSFSRSYMNDIYFKASDMNIPIYYSNTDCCLLDRENIDKLEIVGNKLGEFKIEYENIARAIIISAKKFLWLYKNGEQRCIWRCKRKDDPEYNFRVFEKMIQE